MVPVWTAKQLDERMEFWFTTRRLDVPVMASKSGGVMAGTAALLNQTSEEVRSMPAFAEMPPVSRSMPSLPSALPLKTTSKSTGHCLRASMIPSLSS